MIRPSKERRNQSISRSHAGNRIKVNKKHITFPLKKYENGQNNPLSTAVFILSAQNKPMLKSGKGDCYDLSVFSKTR
jgi:hypothetical protein